MKIKFIEAAPGRDHKVGDVVEFNGPVPEGYARKYIARGWAVEYQEPAPAAKAEAHAKSEDRPQVQQMQGKPAAPRKI